MAGVCKSGAKECDGCMSCQSKKVDDCQVCGHEICEGEDYYDVNGDIVCDNCNLEYMRQFRKVICYE